MSAEALDTPRVDRGGVILSLVLAGIGLASLVVSIGYGLTDEGRIGPGAFPAFLGACLVVMGLLLSVQAWRNPVASGTAEDDDRSRGSKAFLVLAILAVTVAIAPYVGLMVAMAAMIFVIAAFVERVGLRTAAVLAAGSFAVFFAVFDLLLAIPMPGPW